MKTGRSIDIPLLEVIKLGPTQIWQLHGLSEFYMGLEVAQESKNHVTVEFLSQAVIRP